MKIVNISAKSYLLQLTADELKNVAGYDEKTCHSGVVIPKSWSNVDEIIQAVEFGVLEVYVSKETYNGKTSLACAVPVMSNAKQTMLVAKMAKEQAGLADVAAVKLATTMSLNLNDKQQEVVNQRKAEREAKLKERMERERKSDGEILAKKEVKPAEDKTADEKQEDELSLKDATAEA